MGKDKNTRLIGHVKANNYQQRQNADVWFYKTLRQSCRHNLTGNEWQASDILSNGICNWKRINRNRGHLLNSHQKNYLSEKKWRPKLTTATRVKVEEKEKMWLLRLKIKTKLFEHSRTRDSVEAINLKEAENFKPRKLKGLKRKN